MVRATRVVAPAGATLESGAYAAERLRVSRGRSRFTHSIATASQSAAPKIDVFTRIRPWHVRGGSSSTHTKGEAMFRKSLYGATMLGFLTVCACAGTDVASDPAATNASESHADGRTKHPDRTHRGKRQGALVAMSGSYSADPKKTQFGAADFWTLKLNVRANGTCSFESDEEGIDCDGDSPRLCSRKEMEDPSNRDGFTGPCTIVDVRKEITFDFGNGHMQTYRWEASDPTFTRLKLTNDAPKGSQSRIQTLER
jgi:hypothetical protein